MWRATCFLGSNHPHWFCTYRGAAASVMFEIVRQGCAQIRLAETQFVRICEELCRMGRRWG